MRIVLGLCALALTAACSGMAEEKAPPASAFAEGTCRAVAADVLSLGAASTRLGDGPTIGGDLRVQLREAQSRLDEVAVAAEPAYQPALAALVESAGVVRIRADGNEYDAGLGEQLNADYRAVLDVCT